MWGQARTPDGHFHADLFTLLRHPVGRCADTLPDRASVRTVRTVRGLRVPASCVLYTERTHHRGAGQLVPPVHVYQARGRAVRIPRAVTPQVERLASQYFFEMHADKKDMASYRTVQVGLIVGFAFRL